MFGVCRERVDVRGAYLSPRAWPLLSVSHSDELATETTSEPLSMLAFGKAEDIDVGVVAAEEVTPRAKWKVLGQETDGHAVLPTAVFRAERERGAVNRGQRAPCCARPSDGAGGNRSPPALTRRKDKTGTHLWSARAAWFFIARREQTENSRDPVLWITLGGRMISLR